MSILPHSQRIKLWNNYHITKIVQSQSYMTLALLVSNESDTYISIIMVCLTYMRTY